MRRRKRLGELPTTGKLPIDVAKRALVRLPKKLRACVPDADVLREGMEVEREHRNITKGRVGTTAKIAAVHICERGDYYSRLKKFVEKK